MELLTYFYFTQLLHDKHTNRVIGHNYIGNSETVHTVRYMYAFIVRAQISSNTYYKKLCES